MIEFRILMHENFNKDTVYLGIRWRILRWKHAIKIPIPFYYWFENMLSKA